ncbi:hypothetical protein KP803_00630 [Vibrio sp. ZSDE26]|uniref:Uncharacterized protein n=1 Tax=Vibrio amylolyticus TaxID=2847292 RepID=A0A9X2BHW9_9VIBR|nr:hypothetical protein [Vibrio amylolyticus]MCK6261772.1 hypothetical protein [Vibrio amylolyticus]
MKIISFGDIEQGTRENKQDEEQQYVVKQGDVSYGWTKLVYRFGKIDK